MIYGKVHKWRKKKKKVQKKMLSAQMQNADITDCHIML